MPKLFVIKNGHGEYEDYWEYVRFILSGNKKYKLEDLVKEFEDGPFEVIIKEFKEQKKLNKNKKLFAPGFIEPFVDWLVKEKKMKKLEFEEWCQ
ncbi:hypothetical protein C4565_00795 [Candidatus Parcubacteria bacterium]|nr:MAG: hypothetical protein C4565_00795 [Candidatus Parcubacteria bacterium]